MIGADVDFADDPDFRGWPGGHRGDNRRHRGVRVSWGRRTGGSSGSRRRVEPARPVRVRRTGHPAATPSGPALSALADPAWVATTAKKTGIPPRALAAYAGVAISFESRACGIGWNTLAGIGEIESRHGTIFGGSIAADGAARPPIFGVPLAGGAVANIPDSDKGAIDGDATIDRAVGPMQLIPEAWRNWHADGNADGVQDPQNIDDATLAAAAYLCRAGGQKLDTEAGWRQAVLAYNGSEQYLADVIRYSTDYARDVDAAR